MPAAEVRNLTGRAGDNPGVQRILRDYPAAYRRFFPACVEVWRVPNHTEVFLGVFKILIDRDLCLGDLTCDESVPRNGFF